MSSEEAIKEMMENLAEALKPQDQFALASEPFSTEEPQHDKYERLIIKPNKKEEVKKELKAFTTGIPFGSNCLLTGLPNSGKSLLLEQIALQTASNGKRVCYITSEEAFHVEAPRFDLEARLKERAGILGLEWDKIAENLFVMDLVTFAELRDWYALASTFRVLVEKEKIDLVLIDSLTMCEDSRGQIKYRLGELVKYCQPRGLTSIMINQRASDSTDSFSMAGNIGISHIADIVMILDYKRLSSWDKAIKLDTGGKQTEVVYFFRILKNRMSRYKANYFRYYISPEGLVKLQPKVDEEK